MLLYDRVVAFTHVALSDLEVGDWVIPAHNAWGTWRSHAVAPANNFIKVVTRHQYRSCATVTVTVSNQL